MICTSLYLNTFFGAKNGGRVIAGFGGGGIKWEILIFLIKYKD